MWYAIVGFTRLRWRLLRGAIRRGGTDQVGAVLSIVASGVVGAGGAIAVFAIGRHDEYRSLLVLVAVGLVIAILGFGVVAGVTQPIDPRVIATEPLDDRERSIGLLAGAAFGPPGLAGIVVGLGLAAGSVRSPGALVPVTIAVTGLLLSLLLAARTATNVLGLLIARRPRTGQLVAGLGGLLFYGLFQFVPAAVADLDRTARVDLAAALRWTPPGQLGHAVAVAGEHPLRAIGHALIGGLWLVPLAFGFVATTRALAVSVRSAGSATARDPGRVATTIRLLCGTGPVGAIAWRSLVVRFRHPRTALETVTGAGVGLAAVLAPALLRDDPGSGAVLVGGAVQLAVLFMAGNSFGNDGPPIAYEMLAGASPRVLATGKARSIIIVAAPLALIGPLLAASITGAWEYLPAGFGVGIGGLLAGAGAAVVQSVLVPIAIPESDNPFASGESGKGIMAAGLLIVVLLGLAVATVPVGLALFWALERGRVGFVTAFGIAAIAVGWGVLRAAVTLSTRRLTGRDQAFVEAVTPAR